MNITKMIQHLASMASLHANPFKRFVQSVMNSNGCGIYEEYFEEANKFHHFSILFLWRTKLRLKCICYLLNMASADIWAVLVGSLLWKKAFSYVTSIGLVWIIKLFKNWVMDSKLLLDNPFLCVKVLPYCATSTLEWTHGLVKVS